MNKTAIFAFRGDSVCFVHVLLNALDLYDKGQDIKIVLEGEATRLIVELRSPEHPLNALYERVKRHKLIDAVCRACAIKMGALEAAEEEGLRVAEDMAGHAGMAPYIEEEFTIVTL